MRSGTTLGGGFRVTYTPVPDPIPVNTPFELEITVADARDGAPVTEAELTVSGWMPAHGHGMLREPRVVERGAGRHRVRGLLFHMRGDWELNVDVTVDRVSERIVFAVHLP